MFKTEKWFTFIILAFVLLIVSFNLTGSLALLVIEKKQDIKLMKSIGMKSTQVRQIFFNEGLLISAIGALIGLVSGLAFCYAQIHFGFIKISGAIVESYPMHVALIDVILCLVSVLVIGVLASIYPAFKASKYHA
jgi:lipoprotein-releasing system permease protein